MQVSLLYRRTAEVDVRLLHLLEDHLVSEGYTVFIDRHMSIGVEWAQEIETQIRASDVVVVLLSESSMHSEMVEHELTIAQEAAQQQDGTPRIVSVRVDYDGPFPQQIVNVVDPLPQVTWTGPDDDASLLSNVSAYVRAPIGGALHEFPALRACCAFLISK